MSVTLSPKQISKRYGVDHAKVLKWIDSGQLKAINVASTQAIQPRWRITAEALAEFESARANIKPQAPQRKTAAATERRYY